MHEKQESFAYAPQGWKTYDQKPHVLLRDANRI
jgi:hypothetical protein